MSGWNEDAVGGNVVNIPPFTIDREVAQGWLGEGKSVVVRHVLAGNSGEGIELINAPRTGMEIPQVPEAPLYTQYVKKRDEYRVHVVKGVVTDVQRKARSTSTPDSDVNWAIRNTSGGFIFARDGITPDSSVMEQAKLAVLASGLDFGAVDIIWNAHQRKAYVLEINTACGLEGTTLERYTAAFIAVLRGDSPQEVDMSVVDEVAVEEATEAPTAPRELRVGDRVMVSQGMPGSHSSEGPGVNGGMVELCVDGAILTIERINSQGEIFTGNWYWLPEWLTLVEEEEDSPETPEATPAPTPTPSPIEQAAEEIQLILDGINLTYGPRHTVRFSGGRGLLNSRYADNRFSRLIESARRTICEAHIEGTLQVRYSTRRGDAS
jgi:hypothetical protein